MKKHQKWLSLLIAISLLLICLPMEVISAAAVQPVTKIEFAWSELPSPGEKAEQTIKRPTLVGASQTQELTYKFKTARYEDVTVFSANERYDCYITFKTDGEFPDDEQDIELIFNGKRVPSSRLWRNANEPNIMRINISFYCGWKPAKTANFIIDTEAMVGKTSTDISLTLDDKAVVTEDISWSDLEIGKPITGTFLKGKRYLVEYLFQLPGNIYADPLWTELSVNGVPADINAFYTVYHTGLQPGEWILQDVIAPTDKPLAFVNYVVLAGAKTPTASTTLSTTTSGTKVATTTTAKKPPVAGSTTTTATGTANVPSVGSTTTNMSTTTTAAPEKLVVLVETDTATVEAAADAFPADTRVKLEALAADTLSAPVKTALQELAEKFVAYEITATANNEAVQPTGTVQVTFVIPAEYDLDKVAVLYVSPDGRTETISSTVDRANGKIIAQLSHFSTYVVAELEKAPETTTGTTAAPDTDAGTDTDTTDTEPTGFPWAIVAVVAAGLIAGGVAAWYFLVFRKK